MPCEQSDTVVWRNRRVRRPRRTVCQNNYCLAKSGKRRAEVVTPYGCNSVNDYNQDSVYFITIYICVKNRCELLGAVVGTTAHGRPQNGNIHLQIS